MRTEESTRRHARHPISFEINLRSPYLKENIEGKTFNISLQGLGVKLPQAYEIPEESMCTFVIKGPHGPILGQAEVRWISREVNQCAVGLFIIERENASHHDLSDVIQKNKI